MTEEKCKGFRVLPSTVCYPISIQDYSKIFDEYHSKNTLNKIKDSLIVHTWNKLTSPIRLSVHSNAAYIELAKVNCPKVFHACMNRF